MPNPAEEDANQLRELVLWTGFRRVDLAPFSVPARFPNPDTFIAGEIEVDTAAIPSMQNWTIRVDGRSLRS